MFALTLYLELKFIRVAVILLFLWRNLYINTLQKPLGYYFSYETPEHITVSAHSKLNFIYIMKLQLIMQFV